MNANSTPTDAQITFADHMGRFYSRRYGFPPMLGRVVGYLAVCEPPEQTIAELADALLASRSAITGAVKLLETMHTVRRSRSAGERVDKVWIDVSTPQSMGMDITEYQEMAELMQEGLQVVRDTPIERQAILLEMAAFAEFILEYVPKMQEAWEERREALVASGEIPDTGPHHGWKRS